MIRAFAAGESFGRGLAAAATLGALFVGGCRSVPPPADSAPVTVVRGPGSSPSSSGTAAVEPPPPPAPVPDPVAPAAPLAPPPQAPAEEARVDAAVVLRVGLASDLSLVTLPCCDGEVEAEVGAERIIVTSPLRVEPAAVIARPGVFRVQVAALKDEGQAAQLARRLGRDVGVAADSVFDAASDLYRVRLGRFADRAAAEALQKEVGRHGVDVSWVVSEGGGVGDAGFLVSQAGVTRRIPGRWFRLGPRGPGGGAVRVEGRRYRGAVLLFINDRGTINVINEVPLEEYLRGVVPREMGPRVFNQVEAIKAQAIAARTYALRTLGEFRAEGYDLCATPRCQVYGGMEDEDPLSDRAIAETQGQVLVAQGEIVDALYSSTCGGHTEDVERIFPLKTADYLRGVPCLEAGGTLLGGSAEAGSTFPGAVVRQRLTAPNFAAQLGEIALLAGLPEAVAGTLEDPSDRRAVVRFAVAALRLEDDVDLFVPDEDPEYYFPAPPAGWTREDLRQAAYLLKLDLLDGPLDRPCDAAERESFAWRLALHLGVFEEVEISYRSLEGGRLAGVPRDGGVPAPAAGFAAGAPGVRIFDLPATGLSTFRRVAGSSEAPRASTLALVPGDRLRVVLRQGEPVAVVQEVSREGVAFDRTSNRSSWTRRRSLAELEALVRQRYPGFLLRDIEVLERGSSGRVSKIRLLDANAGPTEVEGLAVRWTLDLPDTWFSFERLGPTGRPSAFLFRGRGWGHGVGMCQVGTYGMAVRGRTYDEILRHYYSGAVIAPLESLPRSALGRPAATG